MPKIISSDIKPLTKKYHELPRYPVVTYGYEKEFKKRYQKTLDNTFMQLTKKMIDV